ncbi:MAG: hypothetical protein F6K55_26320 [Moorea sp. SIO4A3]|nr:hypothetical protein [Moorena sp. SIO4A3]
MGFRKERHSITNLQMHLICVTKYRQKILTLTSLRSIENSFREVAKKINFEIREFNGLFAKRGLRPSYRKNKGALINKF